MGINAEFFSLRYELCALPKVLLCVYIFWISGINYIYFAEKSTLLVSPSRTKSLWSTGQSLSHAQKNIPQESSENGLKLSGRVDFSSHGNGIKSLHWIFKLLHGSNLVSSNKETGFAFWFMMLMAWKMPFQSILQFFFAIIAS